MCLDNLKGTPSVGAGFVTLSYRLSWAPCGPVTGCGRTGYGELWPYIPLFSVGTAGGGVGLFITSKSSEIGNFKKN